MLIEVLLSGAAGFCAKACDEFCEKKFSSKKLAILAAIIYPLTLAYLTSTTPLSSLFLALAIASIFAGKIDHYMHLFSLSLYTLAVLILPLQFFDTTIFSLFLASAFLDEIKISFKCFSFFSKNRLFAPLAAFFIFLYSGQYIFLIALASFDMAYRAFKFLLKYRAPAPAPSIARAPAFVKKEPYSQAMPSAFLQKPPMAQNSPLLPILSHAKKENKKKHKPTKKEKKATPSKKSKPAKNKKNPAKSKTRKKRKK